MRKTIRGLLRNDFIKGSALLTTTTLIANVLNYFFNVLAARALGPTGFGEITAMLSYTVVLSIPMSVMSLAVINKIGSKGENAARFAAALQDWFFSKVRKWWFLFIPLAIIIPFVPRLTNLSPVVGYALIPYVVLIFVGAFYGSVLQGLLLFFWISLINIITSSLKLSGGILVLTAGGGIGTVIAFLLLSAIIPFVSSYIILKRRQTHKIHLTDKLNKRLTHALLNRYVITTFFSILAITLLNNLDIIFVKKFFSPESAGIYSSWSLFAKIILYFTGPLSLVSFIFFSDTTSKKSHERILTFSLGILTIIGIVSYIFYRYFSLFAIHILFGNKFDAVSPYMGSASMFGTFYTTITFVNNYFLAKSSNYSLMLCVLIPIYLYLVVTVPRTLGSLISLNVYFSLGVLVLYLVAYGHMFFYNGANGKKKV
ncbi:oligosaccharide flippase family protein [Candidatus Microgenomates bacterium]|nr:oligosaccharide flippase family protein [Candidatus Microgenomates bacterium]